MRVALGNRHAIHRVPEVHDGELVDVVKKLPRGKRATVVEIPDDYSLSQAFTTITHPQGVWANHATDGATPAWVASDNPSLAVLVADHFGGIEVRELEEEPS